MRPIVIAVITLAACGVAPTPPPEGTAFYADVIGLTVYVDAATVTDGLDAEIERAVSEGLAYWGASPDAIRGWTLIVAAQDRECQSIKTMVTGCAEWAARRLTVSAIDGCRTAILGHEIGHVIIGDPGHFDPRWAGADASTPCR